MKKKIAIIIVLSVGMLIMGTQISSCIQKEREERKEQYDKAAKIETQAEFAKAIKKEIGWAFIYGKMAAVDPVSYPEIEGEYIAAKKVKERKVRHVDVITDYDSKGKISGCHTRVYYTWETEAVERKQSKEVVFCGMTIQTGKIDLPSKRYIRTITESRNLRYQYYGIKNNLKGTLYANLKKGTIEDKAEFYQGKDIGQIIDYLDGGWEVPLFWTIWVIITTIGVIVIVRY